jgi:ABC-type Fe3+-hydroxamate transport system substrate-binding protein
MRHSQQFRDATGARWQPANPPSRIVSLVPSLTEALFAFGVGKRVVGVTKYCEEPAALVASLPKVGGTKTPDLSAIGDLCPDVVIASVEENREQDIVALRNGGTAVFVTHYPSVAAALAGLQTLADIVGAVDGRRRWLHEAQMAVAATPSEQRPVPYFCPIWRHPYMIARRDTYMADLLALAGGISAFPNEGDARYNAVDLAGLGEAAPELILLPDEPYPFSAKHLADFEPYGTVPAVARQQLHFIDGKALTWYGPRTTLALAQLRALFDRARCGSRPVAGGEARAD